VVARMLVRVSQPQCWPTIGFRVTSKSPAEAPKDWRPIFVLPNVELQEAIEGDLAVLAPQHDPRVAALKHAHATFGRFLSSFTDAFGVKLAPTVLLLRSNAPSNFGTVDAIASFRDLIAISVIGYGRALALKYGHQHHVLFGNTFAFYPWMVDEPYECLISKTPAQFHLHEVEKFRGQSSPELFRVKLDTSSIDKPLLRELLARWHRGFGSDEPDWPELALFRSLNMAHHASLMPAASDLRVYDVGRIISLWDRQAHIGFMAHPSALQLPKQLHPRQPRFDRKPAVTQVEAESLRVRRTSLSTCAHSIPEARAHWNTADVG